jgi:hypothetical protein
VQKSKKPASKAGFSTAAVSRNAGLMLLRHSSNPEAASHFVYPIRHNSLNRKPVFYYQPSSLRTSFPPALSFDG